MRCYSGQNDFLIGIDFSEFRPNTYGLLNIENAGETHTALDETRELISSIWYEISENEDELSFDSLVDLINFDWEKYNCFNNNPYEVYSPESFFETELKEDGPGLGYGLFLIESDDVDFDFETFYEEVRCDGRHECICTINLFKDKQPKMKGLFFEMEDNYNAFLEDLTPASITPLEDGDKYSRLFDKNGVVHINKKDALDGLISALSRTHTIAGNEFFSVQTKKGPINLVTIPFL